MGGEEGNVGVKEEGKLCRLSSAVEVKRFNITGSKLGVGEGRRGRK